jgi:NarL family two-component system response regulator LiaR
MDPIQVLIVDDHTMVRMGLKLCLRNYPEITVVGEAANGKEALQKIEVNQPHVILMDLIMPEMNGVEAIREINLRWPAVKVIALTSFTEDEHITAAIDAGASGYLLKDVEPPALVAAIKDTYRGEVPLHPQAAKVLVDSWRDATNGSSTLASPSPLTPRETDVLRLLGRGKTNRAIAEELVIAEKTVKAHVSSILSKFGVRNRWQAVRRARQLGLLPPLSSS